MSYQEIKEQAIRLDIKQRAALAHELLKTLEESSKEEIEALWLEEVGRRIDLIAQGKMRLIPGEEVRKRVPNNWEDRL